MGAQNGTYVPWHEPVWGHAKTRVAAAVLVAAKIPEEYAPLLVGRALHALSCWALRDGDTGCLGRLSDAEVAQIAWPEGVAKGRLRPARIGRLIRDCLHAAGLLEGEGPEERIHDFQDHNRRVLFDRERRRTVRGQSTDRAADSPRLARALGVEAERRRGGEAEEAGRDDDALPTLRRVFEARFHHPTWERHDRAQESEARLLELVRRDGLAAVEARFSAWVASDHGPGTRSPHLWRFLKAEDERSAAAAGERGFSTVDDPGPDGIALRRETVATWRAAGLTEAETKHREDEWRARGLKF